MRILTESDKLERSGVEEAAGAEVALTSFSGFAIDLDRLAASLRQASPAARNTSKQTKLLGRDLWLASKNMQPPTPAPVMSGAVERPKTLCSRHSREHLSSLDKTVTRISESAASSFPDNLGGYSTTHINGDAVVGARRDSDDERLSTSAILSISPPRSMNGGAQEDTLLDIQTLGTPSNPTFAHVHCMPCSHCRQVPWPFSPSCMHVAFLAFFVVFLVVGVALTVLGFLNYGEGGSTTNKAFRILGIVALILCIGFLIAACVLVSECVTSVLKHPDAAESDGYSALCPTVSETFHYQNSLPDFSYANQCSFHSLPLCREGADGQHHEPTRSAYSLSEHAHAFGTRGKVFRPCMSCSCPQLRQSLSHANGISVVHGEPTAEAPQQPPKRDVSVLSQLCDRHQNLLLASDGDQKTPTAGGPAILTPTSTTTMSTRAHISSFAASSRAETTIVDDDEAFKELSQWV